MAPDGALMAVAMGAGDELRPGKPRRLFQTQAPFSPSPFVYQYAATRDGSRFLVVTEAAGDPATVALNWRAHIRPGSE